MKRWIVLAVLAAGAWAQTETKLPEGEGKKLVQDICSKCHDLDAVVHLHNSKETWNKVVDEMVGRGAEGTDQELETIVDYLAKNFGKDSAKIKINQAPAKEIVAVLGLPEDVAGAIVAERTKNGPFKDWADLKRVSALDVKSIEAKKDRIEF
jgi:competence ComEA-like helix-hairpin-helix protein